MVNAGKQEMFWTHLVFTRKEGRGGVAGGRRRQKRSYNEKIRSWATEEIGSGVRGARKPVSRYGLFAAESSKPRVELDRRPKPAL